MTNVAPSTMMFASVSGCAQTAVVRPGRAEHRAFGNDTPKRQKATNPSEPVSETGTVVPLKKASR